MFIASIPDDEQRVKLYCPGLGLNCEGTRTELLKVIEREMSIGPSLSLEEEAAFIGEDNVLTRTVAPLMDVPRPPKRPMKTIVAGGRDVRLTEEHRRLLDTLGIKELVSGCCSGVDSDAEAWARDRGVPIKKFPARWKVFGRAAGPIRNRAMAEYADAVVLLPGGAGTHSMRNEAEERGIAIYTLDRTLERVQ